jgi:hypothetical protein
MKKRIKKLCFGKNMINFVMFPILVNMEMVFTSQLLIIVTSIFSHFFSLASIYPEVSWDNSYRLVR